MGELRLGRVHAADQHGAHQVHALLLGQAIAVLLGLEELDEIVARVAAAAVHQRACVVDELGGGPLQLRQPGGDLDRVELALDQVGPRRRRSWSSTGAPMIVAIIIAG